MKHEGRSIPVASVEGVLTILPAPCPFYLSLNWVKSLFKYISLCIQVPFWLIQDLAFNALLFH